MDDGPRYSQHSRDLLCDIAISDSRIEVEVFAGELNEEHVKQIITRVQQVAGSGVYPVLVVPDKNAKISIFALKALASEEAMRYAKATAYITRSFHHRVMAEFLLARYSPSRPIRMFSEKPEALGWLQTFH